MPLETFGIIVDGFRNSGDERPLMWCRKPRNRANSRKTSGQSRRSDWLAGDAVDVQPVSATNSLVSGNFTGNFAFFRDLGSTSSLELPVVRRLSKQIPYATKQGNSSLDEGISKLQ